MASKEYSDRVVKNLQYIIDKFDEEDRPTRERQVRQWKKYEFYWSGLQRLWWDSTAHDWRNFDVNSGDDLGQSGYYDKPINVFRAYLESIIAALSANVPAITCFPDDPDNEDDMLTAKGGTKIAKLVYDHIDAEMKFIKGLYVYCTQGTPFAYNYSVESHEYGSVSVNEYDDVEEDIDVAECPNCKMPLEGETLEAAQQMKQQQEDVFRPEAPLADYDQTQGVLCPQCQMMINPEWQTKKILVERLTGVVNKPKARQQIEIMGGLFVKVPNWARCQADLPYLAYEYETHWANVLSEYPELRTRLKNGLSKVQNSNPGGQDYYGRWGRIGPQYMGTEPDFTPTVRNWWLRKCAFELIEEKSERDELCKLFPDGVKCVWINDTYAEACPQKLDDYWTMLENPLSEYVHFDPLGSLLISVQDITNDLLSLTLQTIEHGIPQTFADPSVVNFEQYRTTEATPGALFPAKAKSGKSLGDGFFTVSTAALSKEVQPFSDQIQEMGQFVSGAMPTLWGGALSSSTRTAAQSQMSRNQSLQRLQTTWKMYNVWWKRIFSKVIPAYLDTMLDDERLVEAKGDSFVNVVIKKAEMTGKIGSIHLESSEELPKTWSQVRDIIMELVQLQNPEIMEILGAPENLEVLARVFSPTGLKVPNEADREKQYEEINRLVKTDPIMNGMEIVPSVMPEMDVDNHAVEGEICRQWLVGESGRQAKIDNPMGYQNVLAHMKMHQVMMQQQQMMQQMMAPQQQEPVGEEQNV